MTATMTPTPAPHAGRPGVVDHGSTTPARNPWIVFALLAAAQFVVVLDAGIVYVALPSIQTQLDLDQAGVAWVMDAYMVAFGGFLLLSGRAADLLGRRRVLLGGLVLFGVASLLCGLATEGWQLIAARCLQGLGAAVVSPTAMATIFDLFDGPSRYKALGLFGGVGGLAGATGTLFGGLLTTAGWQWTFLVNVPIITLVFVLGHRLLPRHTRQAEGGLDVVGAVTAVSALCLLLYAVLHLGMHGLGRSTALAACGAVVLSSAFAVNQLRAVAPLVPRELLRLRSAVMGNLANTVVGALLFGGFFITTLHMQQVRGHSPLDAALRIAPLSLAVFVGSQLAAQSFRRIGPARALAAGLALQAVAMSWWGAWLGPDTPIVTGFVLPGVLWGLGLGASIVAAFVVCTSGLSGPVSGAAAGLVSTTLQVGGALGVAGVAALVAQRAGAAAAVPGGDVALATSGAFSVALRAAGLLALLAAGVAALLHRQTVAGAPGAAPRRARPRHSRHAVSAQQSSGSELAGRGRARSAWARAAKHGRHVSGSASGRSTSASTSTREDTHA